MGGGLETLDFAYLAILSWGRENKVRTGAGMFSTLKFLGGRIDPGSALGRGENRSKMDDQSGNFEFSSYFRQ